MVDRQTKKQLHTYVPQCSIGGESSAFMTRSTVRLWAGLVAAATFSLLDLFAPSVSGSARQGAGFGVGAGLVGWPAGGLA